MSEVLSNEMSVEYLACSTARAHIPEVIPQYARCFHIPMQELRIGFREHDEQKALMSLEELQHELYGS